MAVRQPEALMPSALSRASTAGGIAGRRQVERGQRRRLGHAGHGLGHLVVGGVDRLDQTAQPGQAVLVTVAGDTRPAAMPAVSWSR
jgi:hypothetical protein